ncbi:MAG TPA: efflux RND transporter periplasmic adaptor subunit [Anaeromyxobacteraceae bacterium]
MSEEAKSARGRWAAAVVLVLAVLLGAWWFARGRGQASGEGKGGPGGAAAAQRPVPVAVAVAARRDVPVFLEGLGSVVAFQTVTVKSQVDGRLDKVLFREGQAVRRGDVLAQIDARPFQAQLQQAEGALARDEAQLLSARRDLERYRALAAEKLVPQQQADQQVAAVGQFEGAVRIDQAAVATARLNLDYARITAPIDGVTGIRAVDAGNIVHASDQTGLVVLTQLDPVAVIFTLPQDELTPIASALASGQLPVDVYARDGTTLLGSGQLAVIDNQINQATSTVRLKAAVPNPKRLLWPNQFVNARLRLGTRKGALVVPAPAVQRGPNGTFVYVVGQDATVAVQVVQIEATVGDLALVAKGVDEGARVVVEGQSQLRPGAKVTAREPGKPGEQSPPAGKPAPGGADGGRPAGSAAR